MTERMHVEKLIWPWAHNLPDAVHNEFYSLPTEVQENLCFEARCMVTSIEDLIGRGIHKVWLGMHAG